MKAKTIRVVLRKKIDEWLATIEDEDLRKSAKRDVIVTGGAVASMLLKEPVNDFDVYFRTRETTAAVARYYMGKFSPKSRKGIPCQMSLEELPDRIKIVIKSAGIASEEGTDKPYQYFEAVEGADQYVSEVMRDAGDIQDTYEQTQDAAERVEDKTYRPVFMSTNAITLSNRVQIVTRFFGEPDQIHENYDFVHCTNYWTSHDDKLILRPDALEALLSRELRYVGSRYPICSLIRLRKFIARGWTVNAGQILKMVMQISELNLKDVSVLEDQLTGVDAAYFCEIISKLRDKDPTTINSAYLIEIIDRMF